MNEVLAIGLQAMQADAARVDQAGINIANILTPGYKRGIAVQQAAFANVLDGARDSREAAAVAAPAIALQVDTRAATLKATGQPLDLALGGRGWFEVMTASGPGYTRQGNFRLDARGRLVTAQGDPVMGTGGEIVLTMKRPVVSPSGEVRDADAGPGSQPLARLRVVDFEQGAQPQRLGDGLFAPMPGAREVEDAQLQVRQGYLENSNVDAAYEMTNLTVFVRHFETMQKVVAHMDDMLGTAIRKLGETS
jgi:flagellar basal-body rod protein FlgG